MSNTKMTKKEYFVELLNMVTGTEHESEFAPFLEHEIELIENKKKNSKPTKVQEANEKLMSEILIAMSAFTEPLTISEMQKRSSELARLSNQKISAMLKKLIERGKVVKVTEKKKSYFSLVEEA